MKDELLKILEDTNANHIDAETALEQVLDLFIVRLSLPDSEINDKAEEYADALNLTDALQREACTEDLKATAKWRWLEIEKVLKGNEA